VELNDLLARIGAPDDLIREVERELLDLEQAWEEVRAPAERVWLAAVAGAPLVILLEALGDLVEAGRQELAGDTSTLAAALSRALGDAPAEACAEAAAVCEELAARPPSGYREQGASARAYRAAARAAAGLARAAEGLRIAEAQREATRLDAARSAGALVGVAAHAVLPPEAGPLRLSPLASAEDPAHGMLLYAVASLAEAAGAAGASDPESFDAALRELLEEGE
jgi:hypothetical protein